MFVTRFARVNRNSNAFVIHFRGFVCFATLHCSTAHADRKQNQIGIYRSAKNPSQCRPKRPCESFAYKSYDLFDSLLRWPCVGRLCVSRSRDRIGSTLIRKSQVGRYKSSMAYSGWIVKNCVLMVLCWWWRPKLFLMFAFRMLCTLKHLWRIFGSYLNLDVFFNSVYVSRLCRLSLIEIIAFIIIIEIISC